MRPGSRWVYREAEGGGPGQRVVVTVSGDTKTIANGVEARFVRDVVTSGGKPIEITEDWYAQDQARKRLVSGRAAARIGSAAAASTAEEALRFCRHHRPEILNVDLELDELVRVGEIDQGLRKEDCCAMSRAFAAGGADADPRRLVD